MNIQSRSLYPGASALPITCSVALSIASAIFLAAASVHAAAPESSAAPKPTEARKSAPVEFSTNRKRVGGREIAGFSARQARVAQERNLTAPAELKPVEQEAWLAMARREGASGGNELASFYPKHYGEPFVLEGEGERGSWVTTGSLGTARAYHTATLLPSGKVLVAGGVDIDRYTSRYAELYDPATRSWSYTGSLGTARASHTATLLPSGKVLVAGGVDKYRYTSRYAELYDPATGSWSYTGSLTPAREFHTATLLPSGKVLVVGGLGYGDSSSSAELYDPASGGWSSTGSLVTGHISHTATLLPSGKVLVAGGRSTSAELYDPATGSWSSTGGLGTDRSDHTATLLLSGQVLVAGGFGSGSGLSSAELYDPATGNWSNTGNLVAARAQHTATLLPSGKVLVAAGSYLRSAELYDPATESWSSTGSLNNAGREDHSATLLPSGKVLVAGGSVIDSLSSAELYDPATVSQITPAGTTCSQFSSDTAKTLGSVQYGLGDDLIDRVAPHGFLYWVPVTAPAGDNVFRIIQTITSGNFNTFFAGKVEGSNVFDSNCVSLQWTGSQRGKTLTVRFNAPVAGTYFIAIKFDARSLIGEPAPGPAQTVHYQFTTKGVPHSTNEADLVKAVGVSQVKK